MKAIIERIITETPRVLSFVVKPGSPMSFKTGQAMRWNIPNVPAGRLFSVATPGGDSVSELWFTIRIFDEGKFTSHLRSLKAGDPIELLGPYGNFIFDETIQRDIGLIAGGSGVSVLRAIYLHVLTKKLPKKVHLVFSVINVDEIIYRKELEDLARTHNNFTYTVVVTEPHPSWKGKTGFVTSQIFSEEFKDYREEFFICGPQPFIDCAETILNGAGVPKERIHIDYWKFYPPKLMK
ncbi:MAG: hypothetical protein A3B30_01780 [Candidatus Komeilibacteria bacterium RIFCSPLOWO2_01_FULL_52_15]|uniref:FAD-binding FR-type domain-containing protein n=1 Tax=Candidatus Komeilibacteria bacterium RIFCSPLOWO2_01_FULL_52_15 TaxID=1798551 RepID=A0A1G2BS34_9BACT|nr:MAG: hypothetical protein A3B30_01780 [Candidatus Komeilibacteria bacterium RIFCSPLOWO2_01_FULL_52_15]